MKSIKIKSLMIGEGKTKICVSLIEQSVKALIEKAQLLATLPIDIVEWRADFFTEIEDSKQVLTVLKCLKEILQAIPILFTVRSQKEGGEKTLSDDYLHELQLTVIHSALADIIDIEYADRDKKALTTVVNCAKQQQVITLFSHHNFNETPSKETIITHLTQMQLLGADITKIAVMPHSKQDVLTLLSASVDMQQYHADRPFITISMGQQGMISRLIGEFTGSAMTFASVGKSSAPGQIGVEDLNKIIMLIDNVM